MGWWGESAVPGQRKKGGGQQTKEGTVRAYTQWLTQLGC